MLKKSIYVVIAIVKNNNGKFLLIERYEPEVKAAHLKWELPGGKVNFAESPEQAVEREVYEETGYKIKALQLIPQTQTSIWEYKDKLQHVNVFCYMCKLLSNKKIEVSDHHINNWGWFTKAQILKMDLLPGLLVFVNYLK